MPTFRSVALHPSVTARLLQQEPQVQDSGENPPTGRAVIDHQENGQSSRPMSGQPALARVRSPRALLIRDHDALVELISHGQKIRDAGQRSKLVAQLETIRRQTAECMCQQSLTGKLVGQLHRGVTTHHPTIIQRIPGTSMSGLLLWKSQQQQENKASSNQSWTISTGCRALDELIAFPEEYIGHKHGGRDAAVEMTDEIIPDRRMGGFPRGHVLQVTGNTAKSQLCLQLAVQACLDGSPVRYCYSTAGHSGKALAARCKQLVKHSPRRSATTRPAGSGTKEALKRVEFVPISTAFQLYQSLASLEEELTPEKNDTGNTDDSMGCSASLLIVDALPSMLVEWDGGDPLRHVSQWLKRIARQHSIWIWVTGSWSLSTKLLDAPDVHLHVQSQSESNANVRLLRHSSKLVTSKDCVSLIHTSDFGLTSK